MNSESYNVHFREVSWDKVARVKGLVPVGSVEPLLAGPSNYFNISHIIAILQFTYSDLRNLCTLFDKNNPLIEVFLCVHYLIKIIH